MAGEKPPKVEVGTGALDQVEVAALPRRTIPAWLLSFSLHVVLLFCLLLLLHRFSRGASQVENRAGGIVLVDVISETTEYLSEGEVAEASAAAQSEATPPPAPAEDRPPDLPGLEVAPLAGDGVGQQLAEELSGADGLLEGMSSNRPIGGQVTTEVFGVKGTGSRFIYVFDRSASMEGYEGRPLRAAKQELLKSLESLGETHRFQIIFYNDQTRIFQPEGGAARLVEATDLMKEKGTRFVQSIRGDRGTNHMSALQLALSFGPDVIFLLTDAEGGFTKREMDMLARWNRAGTVINAIEFGVGRKSDSDRSLQQLARENGGQYTYKNVLSFRD